MFTFEKFGQILEQIVNFFIKCKIFASGIIADNVCNREKTGLVSF